MNSMMRPTTGIMDSDEEQNANEDENKKLKGRGMKSRQRPTMGNDNEVVRDADGRGEQ